jgi:tetratricopeptide (TPR) repeat protein
MASIGSKGIVAFITLAAAIAHGSIAFADDKGARLHFQRAQAAYGLGEYAKAAIEFESAYALKPAAELLFDAAQAHRLAGNGPRARLLYENYRRIYGSRVNGGEDIGAYLAKLGGVPASAPGRPYRSDLKEPFADDETDAATSRFRRVKAHYDQFKRAYGLVLENQWNDLAIAITLGDSGWTKLNQLTDTLERDMTTIEQGSPVPPVAREVPPFALAAQRGQAR